MGGKTVNRIGRNYDDASFKKRLASGIKSDGIAADGSHQSPISVKILAASFTISTQGRFA